MNTLRALISLGPVIMAVFCAVMLWRTRQRSTATTWLAWVITVFRLRQGPQHPYCARPLGRFQVKSKQEAVRIYEVLVAEPGESGEAKRLGLNAFSLALEQYRGEFTLAYQGFAALLDVNPADAGIRYSGSRALARGSGSTIPV